VTEPTTAEIIQLHLTHSYKIEISRHPQVNSYLARGYNIINLQRISDRDVLVTLRCRMTQSAANPTT
jgi:hypothetical protein